MARYSATEQSAYESGGSTGFRLEKDGSKARVIFLYEGPESIDGWACHRFQMGARGYTVTVDCPRQSKDPIEKCPACQDGQQLYTRLFVRMYNLDQNKVEVWDRASGFRTELLGQMAYFNPLYSKIYEITRHGSGLQTRYQLQPLNDSGLTPEQYAEYVKLAEEVAEDIVKPIESYQTTLARALAAKKQDAEEEVKVDSNQAAQGAWGQPPQGAWGQPPQQQWGQPPAQGAWGQPPQQQAPSQTPPQSAPQGWGQPPQSNPNPQSQAGNQAGNQIPPWGVPPQGWGQQ